LSECNQKGCCCKDIIIETRKSPSKEEIEWWNARGCKVKGKYVRIPLICPNLLVSGLCKIYDKRPLVCRLYPTKESFKKLKAFGIECSMEVKK